MPTGLPMRVHATTIALGGRAAIIRGPSGSGKSDLALRCLMAAPNPLIKLPAQLVCDDYTELFEASGVLMARSPAQIENLLEVRGIGIIEVATQAQAQVALVVDLVDRALIARLPDPPLDTAFGRLTVPVVRLCPHDASAPAKLLLALDLVRRFGVLRVVDGRPEK